MCKFRLSIHPYGHSHAKHYVEISLGDDALISKGSFMQTKYLCVLIHIWIKGEVGAIKPVLSPAVKYFTDRSKAVLLLWIFYVFVLACVCYVFVCVCLYVLCGHHLGKGWLLGSRLWCLCVCHFPIGILGQVWYLIISIPDLCTLTYFYKCIQKCQQNQKYAFFYSDCQLQWQCSCHQF